MAYRTDHLAPILKGDMELKDLWIRPCTNMADVKAFVSEHHYSHSIKGITPFISFEVVPRDNYQKQVGAAIFGIPGQASTELLYGEYEGSKQENRPWIVAVELRRFVLLDELPKNSESYVLSRMLQKLEILGVERIISYADPNQFRPEHKHGKHTGLIYAATGFHNVKQTGKVSALVMQRDFEMDGKTFKAGRRIPLRNYDQYKNYRAQTLAGLCEASPDFAKDWQENINTGKSKSWVERATGKTVYIVKTEKHLTSLSKRLRAAVKEGAALMTQESGKILHIRDLQPGMEYYDIPAVNRRDLVESNSRPKG